MLREAEEVENAKESQSLIALNEASIESRSQNAITAIIFLLSSPAYRFHTIEQIMGDVVDVNQPGSDGDTMLVAAARGRGKFEVVVMLLNRGADVNKKTTDGVLPIYAASQLGRCVITKLLISQGANIHDRNDDGKYPIHSACSSTTVYNLHFLLSHGASLNVTDYNGKYPIHIASSNNCEEIMLLLLSIGTSINVVDVNGNTPFPLNRYKVGLSPNNILYIKQFALLHFTSGAVNEKDWTIIQRDPRRLSFYQRCYNQLHIMSQTVIYGNLNWLSLLAANTTKLSAYLRNTELAEAIGNSIQQQGALFPIYFKQLVMALEIAKKKCEIIQCMDNVLEQSFPIPLPSLVIQKITHYSLFEELIHLELNYYSTICKRIYEEKRSSY